MLMKFNSCHHIAIIVSDIEKSKVFYSGILGFKIIKETFREDRDSWKIDLEVNPDTQIELFTFPNAPQRPTYPEALGLRHLAFGVPSIEEAVEYLKSKGIEVEDVRVDKLTGKKFTFFSDPDSLPLEIYEL